MSLNATSTHEPVDLEHLHPFHVLYTTFCSENVETSSAVSARTQATGKSIRSFKISPRFNQQRMHTNHYSVCFHTRAYSNVIFVACSVSRVLIYSTHHLFEKLVIEAALNRFWC